MMTTSSFVRSIVQNLVFFIRRRNSNQIEKSSTRDFSLQSLLITAWRLITHALWLGCISAHINSPCAATMAGDWKLDAKLPIKALAKDSKGNLYAYGENSEYYAGSPLYIKAAADQSWRKIADNAANLIIDSNDNIYIESNNKRISVSTDGGLSWVYIFGGSDRDYYSGAYAWASDDSGRVFALTNSYGIGTSCTLSARICWTYSWNVQYSCIEFNASGVQQSIILSNSNFVSYGKWCSGNLAVASPAGWLIISGAESYRIQRPFCDISNYTSQNFSLCNNMEVRSTGVNLSKGRIIRESNGNIIASTDQGIYVSGKDGGTWVAMNNGLPANLKETIPIAADDCGYVYAGTSSGVYVTSLLKKRWELMGSTDVFGKSAATSLVVSAFGDVYASAASGDIYRFVWSRRSTNDYPQTNISACVSGLETRTKLATYISVDPRDAGKTNQFFAATIFEPDTVFSYTDRGWEYVADGNLKPFLTSTANVVSRSLFSNLYQLPSGTVVYAGYGSSLQDMIARGKYKELIRIP